MIPKFPFFTGQQLNLDWVMQMLKKILSFMPIDSGAVGDVLQRKANGAAWEPLSAVSMDIHGLQTAADVADDDELALYDKTATGNRKTTVAAIRAGVSSPVTSVNGKTGVVVLDADDVGALPDSYTAPVSSVNGKTGAVVLDADDVGALPDTVDYIVDSGASGDWRYRKWNSGFLEAWFYGSVDFTAEDGPYNGMYRHVQLIDNFSMFVATYAVLAGGSNSNMFISDASVVNNRLRLVLSHIPSNPTTITVTATTIYETGRWK